MAIMAEWLVAKPTSKPVRRGAVTAGHEHAGYERHHRAKNHLSDPADEGPVHVQETEV